MAISYLESRIQIFSLNFNWIQSGKSCSIPVSSNPHMSWWVDPHPLRRRSPGLVPLSLPGRGSKDAGHGGLVAIQVGLRYHAGAARSGFLDLGEMLFRAEILNDPPQRSQRFRNSVGEGFTPEETSRRSRDMSASKKIQWGNSSNWIDIHQQTAKIIYLVRQKRGGHRPCLGTLQLCET